MQPWFVQWWINNLVPYWQNALTYSQWSRSDLFNAFPGMVMVWWTYCVCAWRRLATGCSKISFKLTNIKLKLSSSAAKKKVRLSVPIWIHEYSKLTNPIENLIVNPWWGFRFQNTFLKFSDPCTGFQLNVESIWRPNFLSISLWMVWVIDIVSYTDGGQADLWGLVSQAWWNGFQLLCESVTLGTKICPNCSHGLFFFSIWI